MKSNGWGGPASELAAAGMAAIVQAFKAYDARFKAITAGAREHFERRDWRGAQADAAARLALYKQHVDQAIAAVGAALAGRREDRAVWIRMRERYADTMGGRPNAELAESFFNSVSRRVFTTVGVDPWTEYDEPRIDRPRPDDARAIYDSYPADRVDADLIRRLLVAHPWRTPYAQLDRDARLVADRVAAGVRDGTGREGPVVVDLVRSVFYRNKGAYLVGRIRAGTGIVPLVIPLLNAERGIVVDAVLMSSDEASVVFGFSWSYFLVEAPWPRALIDFLRSIMPLKRVDELYTSIGYNKHGKTELYRSLMHYLDEPDACFEFAEGDEGMVMGVFTLPSFNVVFKVIKDTFGAPKNTTRKLVMDKYHFVFVRDRVGRLADAQEFEHLEFRTGRFSPELLAYLRRVAGNTVRVEDDRVIVRHLYTERRVTPLNLYLRSAGDTAAREAIVDYGNAIKELAGADIFTGDMLLKNFGVSRHGRVICYDYDELSLLSTCHFRRLPPPASYEDELAAEPWFHVGEHDVFPEEFAAFLVPSGRLRDAFLDAHADLLTVDYWRGVQERLAAGEMFDVFPYPRDRRLQRNAAD